MKKLSEIISKQVYYSHNGLKVGYVLSAEFSSDLKQICGLIIVDEENEVEMRVDYASISAENDVIFLKNNANLVYGEFAFKSVLGKKVYDKRANFLGSIKEIYLKNNKVCYFSTEKITFCSKNIVINGNDALILFGKKEKAEPFNFQNPLIQPEQVVQITRTENVLPSRIGIDARSLLGKIATRDILGINNELIIRNREVITQKKINEAKKHNKLNILFYYSK